MPRRRSTTRTISIQSAATIARFLWPEFVLEHDLVVLAQHSGVNPCPPSTTKTDWEAFVNHTHVFDEFAIKSEAIERRQTAHRIEGQPDTWDEWEITYLQTHPDFVAACEVGKAAARLWALKLTRDFPRDRFRVYYTELDNPIVRFHKVRLDEPVWLPDDALCGSTNSDLRNALIYDTHSVDNPIHGRRTLIH